MLFARGREKGVTDYVVHGLRWRSDFSLPFRSADDGDAHGADVEIRDVGTLSPEDSAGDRRELLVGDDGVIEIRRPRLGRFRMLSGSRIEVRRRAGVDTRRLLPLIYGQCSGGILWQRGVPVLHGNSVLMGESLVVLAGLSGAGKSTLTMALLRRGHRLYGDELCAFDLDGEIVRVRPGLPFLKLCDEGLEAFGLDPASCRPVMPGSRKRLVPWEEERAVESRRVDAVILLSAGFHPEVERRPIPETVRAAALSPLWGGRTLPAGAPGWTSMRARCVHLAERLPLHSLTRPHWGWTPDVICRVIEDMLSEGTDGRGAMGACPERGEGL